MCASLSLTSLSAPQCIFHFPRCCFNSLTICKRTDRVTGSRVKLHLLLKGKEQGMPLKNEFRVTEPAPGTQEVKRSGLVKERPSKCSCPRNYGENWRTTSLDSFDKIKEKKNRKEKGKLACGRLETPGGWLEKSISINCSRRLRRRNLEIERFGRLPPFSGIPVASSATKISILGFLGSCSLWAKDGVRCKDVPVVFFQKDDLVPPSSRHPYTGLLHFSL